MRLRIALIGCGAIGTALLELVKDDQSLLIESVVVPAFATEEAQAVIKRLNLNATVTDSVPLQDIDLVIEAAGHSAIEQHVIPALSRGVPAIVASVGALSSEGLPERLEAAARNGSTQIQLIAGAIGAIDALAAARIGGLASVRYTGRKPPYAWMGTPAERDHDFRALKREVVVFEGSAREAARLFPKNANVAATVSLAGLGLDRTVVRLIADPAVSENIHHLAAEGAFGDFELTLRNKPLQANPKTSVLTVLSAVRALRGRVDPFIV